MGAPPQVTQHIVEALLDTHAKAARNRRLILSSTAATHRAPRPSSRRRPVTVAR